MKEIDDKLYYRLKYLGLIPNELRNEKAGSSDYTQHTIMPWSIWLDYDLDAFDADIVKRVLRKKDTDPRRLDYEKIIHLCHEKIRQIDELDNLFCIDKDK